MTWFWDQLKSLQAGGSGQREIRRARILWFADRQAPHDVAYNEPFDDNTCRYGLILEAAILLGHLEDLPDDSNAERRERDFQDFYKEYLWIRHGLTIRAITARVVREAERTFASVARRLGIPVPITQIE